MDIKTLFDDDRAVSPVIGVILMVAITVILAAVIGSFVLGLGNNLQTTAPNANFAFEYSDNGTTADGAYAVTATHQGGDTIEASATLNLSSDSTGESESFGLPASAGDSATLGDESGETEVPADTTVRVIWTSESGENSQTLAEGTTPN